MEELELDEAALAAKFEAENAAEIAAAKDKQFELTGATQDELAPLVAPAVAAAAAAPEAAAPAADSNARLSPLQRVARLSVGERVKLAFLGNKEERAILIRDGSRVVYSAVVNSPKLTDQEVETIASMKNVQEGVLRELARKRKFIKNYIVVRNLVNNPRCPMDLSLNFLKNLTPKDLKELSMNKGVPETVRKLALRSFKEKSGKKE
ncbi:MAG TPA: hypothetical protein VM009_03055 [Terriglobales bacterium]|nr:hypothetical protein [Terriglobales bacterium]